MQFSNVLRKKRKNTMKFQRKKRKNTMKFSTVENLRQNRKNVKKLSFLEVLFDEQAIKKKKKKGAKATIQNEA